MCPERGFIRFTSSAAYYDARGRLVAVEGDDEYPDTFAELIEHPERLNSPDADDGPGPESGPGE